MFLAATGGAENLTVTFAKALALSVGIFGKAMMAGRAFLVFRALQILGLKRTSACVARDVLTKFQPVRDADPLVKDEAGTMPEAFVGRHIFEVFQDAALEVVNITDTI